MIHAICLLVLGLGYWTDSEGVYALTARFLLDGHALYSEIVVAQPPPLFLFGAGVLAIHDSLPFLRFVFGLLQVSAALVGGCIAWRLTGKSWAMIVVVVLGLFAPWSVREHGFILPEVFASPLVVLAVLLAARKDCAVITGLLLGVITFTKVPFIIFAIFIIAVAVDRVRVAVWTGVTLSGLLIGSFASFGFGPMWRDLIVAQEQSGTRTFEQVISLLGLCALSSIGLLICATLAWRWRKLFYARDAALTRTMFAASFAGLAVTLSTFKVGTTLSILPITEATLAVPAGAALVLALGQLHSNFGSLPCVGWVRAAFATRTQVFKQPSSVYLGVIVVLAGGLVIGQGIAALNSRPRMEDAYVRRTLARIEKCAKGAPVQGTPAPYLAFLSNRSVPDNQPDAFLTRRAPVLAPVLKRMRSVPPICLQTLPDF